MLCVCCMLAGVHLDRTSTKARHHAVQLGLLLIGCISSCAGATLAARLLAHTLSARSRVLLALAEADAQFDESDREQRRPSFPRIEGRPASAVERYLDSQAAGKVNILASSRLDVVL